MQDGQTAEYHAALPMAERVVIATGRKRLGYSATLVNLELAQVSSGYECAGSCARYTMGYWSVRYHDGQAYQGRRFQNEADARSTFAQWRE